MLHAVENYCGDHIIHCLYSIKLELEVYIVISIRQYEN